MRMRSSIVTIALCTLVEAAVAQCPAQVPSIENPSRASDELIKTAAADTRAAQVDAHSTLATAAPASEKRPHRTGTAMLFAALALMSGIALRHYSAPKQ
jgi:hypothetical protein